MMVVDEGCENSLAHDATGVAAKFLRPQGLITFYDAS